MEKLARIDRGAVQVEIPTSLTKTNKTPDIKMPAPNKNDGGAGESKSDSWMPWLIGGGSALLAHSIMSSILEKSDEEKRRESVWSRLLRTIIPLGVGAVGAYGGYNLGKSLEKQSQSMSTNAWDRVVGKNGRFATITPPEYSNTLDQLLQYVDDNDETSWEDIVSVANELYGKKDDPSIERMIGHPLNWGSWALEGFGGGRALYGLKQINDARPDVINAKYMKTLQDIPHVVPPANPTVKKWNKPKTWFPKKELTGPARMEMINNMRRGAKVKLDADNAAAPGKASNGFKNLRKGGVMFAGGMGLDSLYEILNEMAETNENAINAATGFRKIQGDLEAAQRNAKILPENVSKNAPVATAPGAAK